jgi:hypothetical protein
MKTIEKNIPLPSKVLGKQTQYPFKDMSIGDSFLCEVGAKQNRLTSINSRAGKRLGMKFTSRIVEDGRIRVWRIE